jgi:hypothetical protein
MKFFVPNTDSDAEAERVLEGIAKFVGAYVPARRIFKLLYRHNNREFVAEVGQPIAAYYEEGNQPVFAILPFAGGYAICLPLRGVAKGDPILVSDTAVQHIVYFDT